jgi:hypothetical protein
MIKKFLSMSTILLVTFTINVVDIVILGSAFYFPFTWTIRFLRSFEKDVVAEDVIERLSDDEVLSTLDRAQASLESGSSLITGSTLPSLVPGEDAFTHNLLSGAPRFPSLLDTYEINDTFCALGYLDLPSNICYGPHQLICHQGKEVYQEEVLNSVFTDNLANNIDPTYLEVVGKHMDYDGLVASEALTTTLEILC